MKFTNNNNLPQVLVDALTANTYDGKHSDDWISVTTLIKAPKEAELKRRHAAELVEDASENIYRLLGSSVHGVLEKAYAFGRITEERYEQEMAGVKISGKIDMWEAGILYDYKLTSVWSVILSDKKDWVNQVNCYAWLMRQHMGSEDAVQGAKVIALFRDWQKSKVDEEGYPQLPVKILDVPLWRQIDQHDYIADRLVKHLSVRDMQDDEIPICTPEERWQVGDKFAVYKNGNKKALRVFDSLEEAEKLVNGMLVQYQDMTFKVEQRKGKDRKCADYCSVAGFCNYGKKYIEAEAE